MKNSSLAPGSPPTTTPLVLSGLALLFCLLLPEPGMALQADGETVCLVITGLGGMPEYEENFLGWAGKTEQVCADKSGSRVYRIDGRQKKKQDVLGAFQEISRALPIKELWIFLIGHASHDNQVYKFNIRGPDLTDGEIQTFLNSLGESRIYLVAATSASGALAEKLEGPNRVIVTATKSSTEKQPPLFMSFFLEAVSADEADLDKNGRVSIFEAFTFSRQKVSEWFEGKGRIQTEHAILADSGEIRLGRDKEADASLQPGSLLASTAYLSGQPARNFDSAAAQELDARRLALEREVEDLRFRKRQMPEDEYYRRLEILLLELARLNQSLKQMEELP